MINTLKGLINKLKVFTGGKKEYRESCKSIHITENGTAIVTDGYRAAEIKVSDSLEVGTISSEYVNAKKEEFTEEEIIVKQEVDSIAQNVSNLLDQDSSLEIEFKASEILAELKRLYKAQGFTRLTNKSGKVEIIREYDRIELRFKADENVKITFDGQKLEAKGDMWFAKDITDMVTVKYGQKEKMVTLLNAKFLLDALSLYAKDDVVTLGYTSELSPITIKGENVRNLVLPMRRMKGVKPLPVKYIEQFDAEWAEIQKEKERRSIATKKIVEPVVEEVVEPIVEEVVEVAAETVEPTNEIVEAIITTQRGKKLTECKLCGETKTLYKVIVTKTDYPWIYEVGTIVKFKKSTLADNKGKMLTMLNEKISGPIEVAAETVETVKEIVADIGVTKLAEEIIETTGKMLGALDRAEDQENISLAEKNKHSSKKDSIVNTKLVHSTQLLSKIKSPDLLYEIAFLLGSFKKHLTRCYNPINDMVHKLLPNKGPDPIDRRILHDCNMINLSLKNTNLNPSWSAKTRRPRYTSNTLQQKYYTGIMAAS